jgi:enediyne biosynthesis protein E4
MLHPCAGTGFRLSAVLLAFSSAVVCGLAQAPTSAIPQQLPDNGNGASGAAQQQGGSATGGTFAPVLDSENRPITAGGFTKAGPHIFQDISAQAGLTQWTHKMGTPEKPYILETVGSGVALLDYDHNN